MVNISTRYEKVFDKRKKVFMVRGDEAYAHTVDVDLTYSTPTTTSIKGFKTSLTATLYRHQGTSTLLFYDGEELIKDGNLATTQNTSTYTLSDIYLSYGVEHDLYAVYIPNQYTLRGKSKTVKATVEFPESLKTNITISDYDGSPIQIAESTGLTLYATVLQGESTIEDTTYNLYVDGELVDTGETDGSSLTSEIDDEYLPKGEHTVTIEIPQSDVLIYGETSCTVIVGYNVEVIQMPTYFFTGQDNYVKVKVTDIYGNLVPELSVKLAGKTATTHTEAMGDEGIATFNFTSPVAGTYQASVVHETSFSNEITFVVLVSPTVDIKRYGSDSSIIHYGQSYSLELDAPYPYANVDLLITNGIDTPINENYQLDGSGFARFDGSGLGWGETTATLTFGDSSDSLILFDYLYYYKAREISNNLQVSVYNGSKTEVSNGMQLKFPATSGYNSAIIYGSNYNGFSTTTPMVHEFDLLSMSGNFKLYNSITITSDYVGKTFRVEIDDTHNAVVKCGGVTIGSETISGNDYIMFLGGASKTIVINNMKSWRGSDE